MATKDEILTVLLSFVPDSRDKRTGSFVYDVLSPIAEKLAEIDMSIENTKDKMVIDNLTGDELAQRVRERTGIERVGATKATGTVMLTGSGTIQVGSLFETPEGIQFQSTETKTITNTGSVAIEAIIAGGSGVVPSNTITLFPVTLAGFTAVNNPNPTSGGFDEESDASLLQRYYDRLRTPPTSGNKSHYVNWSKEIAGVGNVKVYPLWNGDNTVKVVLTDSNGLPASSTVVQNVQDYIEPNQDGTGGGQAPIGAITTAQSAVQLNINVVVTIELAVGYTLTQAEANISNNIKEYLKSIAFVKDSVSLAKIGSAILDSEGIVNFDYSSLTVNGGTTNITIPDGNVAVLNVLTVNVS